MKTAPLTPHRETRRHGTDSFPCAYYDLNPQQLASGTSFQVKHHWHEEIEIIYLQKGSFHLEFNMEKYDTCEECFCFVNSGELHSLSSGSDFIEKAFVFSPSMLAFLINDPAQQQFIQPLIEKTLILPRFIDHTFPCYEELKQLFLRISEEFLTDTSLIQDGQLLTTSPARQLYIKAGLLQLLALLAQNNILLPASPDSDRRVEMVKKVITYMEQHFSEKIYIHDLAHQINMNEQYFCRFFKKIIGRSPISYLNDLRIRQAARLLRETDHSVMNICLECGFNNLGNFMQIFKKNYNMTPLQFRKQRLTRY